MSTILIRQATIEDFSTVCDILQEAASWLEERNMKLWGEQEISPKVICLDIQSNSFYLAFFPNSYIVLI